MLCPSARCYARRHTPKPLIDHARQAVLQLARWPPGRQVVVVPESGFAVIDLLAAARSRVAVVTRLRLDPALYDPFPAPRPGPVGRPRKMGDRQPALLARAVDPSTVSAGGTGRGQRRENTHTHAIHHGRWAGRGYSVAVGQDVLR